MRLSVVFVCWCYCCSPQAPGVQAVVTQSLARPSREAAPGLSLRLARESSQRGVGMAGSLTGQLRAPGVNVPMTETEADLQGPITSPQAYKPAQTAGRGRTHPAGRGRAPKGWGPCSESAITLHLSPHTSAPLHRAPVCRVTLSLILDLSATLPFPSTAPQLVTSSGSASRLLLGRARGPFALLVSLRIRTVSFFFVTYL